MKKLLLATALASLGFTTAANATIWTVWSSSYTPGFPTGSATGTMGGVGVSYSGEINSGIGNPACGGICFSGPAVDLYPSWTPPSSYVGGIVTTAPTEADGIIQMTGGPGSMTDTITFSAPVKNPVIAIWSLGASGTLAQFVFAETPTFEAGGPSTEYGGSPITVLGDTVSGMEGNGVVALLGTYSSISFTTPKYESWYGFTVGSAVPESSTWAMMMLGFAGLGYAGFRRAAKSRAAISIT
jgi:hypothetical protein